MPFSHVPSTVPCPRCGQKDTESLDRLSALAYVDYFRCPACTHVWTLPRQERISIFNPSPPPS